MRRSVWPIRENGIARGEKGGEVYLDLTPFFLYTEGLFRGDLWTIDPVRKKGKESKID